MIHLRHKLRKGDFLLDVDVEIPDAGVTGVFGESGSGKTSLLRCIAGLDKSDGSSGLPINQRNVGYVFQQPTLFPHLDVRDNIEYGARRATTARVDGTQVIDMLGLENLLPRRTETLSGGEAQRVAIAAALLRSPDIVLMDEPLASLDARRKDELLPYFDRLHEELSIPMIYVSHDIDEISRLCDYLVVLEDGKVTSSGKLFDMLARVDVPMLSDRNAGVVVSATAVEQDEGLTKFNFADEDLWVAGAFTPEDGPLRLRIDASDVSICRERPSETTILNILRAKIDEIQNVDEATALVRLDAGGQFLLAQVTQRSVARLKLVPGDRVFAQVKSVTVRRGAVR